LIQAYQFTGVQFTTCDFIETNDVDIVDKYGESCPANWKPNSSSPTIKANPSESKEYFAKVDGAVAVNGTK
jgi:alkyl hydroperoxide reductase subunit AhpC